MIRKDAFARLLWLVVGFAAFCWVAFAWTSCSGTTLSTKVSRVGHNASAADVEQSKGLAMIATLVALPAAFMLMTRGNKE
ncbi:MAG TPA: hypothetical protein VND45_09685 [Thermoanaerobaculia bacterium]|nr:hypothetical protein [Thermoanaerobaculia bacterium]